MQEAALLGPDGGLRGTGGLLDANMVSIFPQDCLQAACQAAGCCEASLNCAAACTGDTFQAGLCGFECQEAGLRCAAYLALLHCWGDHHCQVRLGHPPLVFCGQ